MAVLTGTKANRLSEEQSVVGNALIIVPDQPTGNLLQNALRLVGISSELCGSIAHGAERVRCRRYEVVFIDFTLAACAVDIVRSSPSSKTAVLVAITSGPEQSSQASASGVHFILQQPTSRAAVDATIRAAYGLIVRERRRYFRCPLGVDVLVQHEGDLSWMGHAVNVSEGGMCVIMPFSLTSGERLQLRFELPNTNIEVSAECDVRWVDENGRAGLSFWRMHNNSQSELMSWLSDELDKRLKPLVSDLALSADENPSTVMASVPKEYVRPTLQLDTSKDDLPAKFRLIEDSILSETPILKVVLDEQHRSLWFSEEFARHLGYTANELVGRPIEEITHQGSVDVNFVFEVAKRFRENKGLWLFEGRSRNRVLCSYQATQLSDRVSVTFTLLT